MFPLHSNNANTICKKSIAMNTAAKKGRILDASTFLARNSVWLILFYFGLIPFSFFFIFSFFLTFPLFLNAYYHVTLITFIALHIFFFWRMWFRVQQLSHNYLHVLCWRQIRSNFQSTKVWTKVLVERFVFVPYFKIKKSTALVNVAISYEIECWCPIWTCSHQYVGMIELLIKKKIYM